MDYSLPGSSVHGDSAGKNTGVGCHALLQRIFPTQESILHLPHCRWILYHLSHQGSPRILEWVAYPFSSRSSQSRNEIGVFCIAGGFFTSWATREGNGTPLQYSCLEKSHGWISLVGYSPWGCKQLNTTEWLHSLHTIREAPINWLCDFKSCSGHQYPDCFQ